MPDAIPIRQSSPLEGLSERLHREAEVEHDRVVAVLEDPFVRDCTTRCTADAMNEVSARVLQAKFDGVWQRHCESPLESAFAACWGIYQSVTVADAHAPGYALHAQAAADPYRLDFEVVLARGMYVTPPIPYGWRRLGVELDGHEFHEQTKEQVTRRNQRDRDLLRLGWHVLRFSGSEFYRHPWHCVDQVWRTADALYASAWTDEQYPLPGR